MVVDLLQRHADYVLMPDAALRDLRDWRRRGGFSPVGGDEGARLLERLVEMLRRANGGDDERRHDEEGGA